MSQEDISSLLKSLIEQKISDDSPLESGNQISQSSTYDFTEHHFLMDPQISKFSDPSNSKLLFMEIMIAAGQGLMTEFRVGVDVEWKRSRVAPDDEVAQRVLESDLLSTVISELSNQLNELPSWESAYGQIMAESLGQAYQVFFESSEWNRKYSQLPPSMHNPPGEAWKDLFSEINDAATESVNTILSLTLIHYLDGIRTLGKGVFTPFRVKTVNFGIQPVYRQSWTALGIQQGEIIKTLPLGPKQTEKISINIQSRTKTSSSRDATVSTTTSSETTDTTKDSSEVVKEAAKSNHYEVSASASYSSPVGIGASVEASAGGNSSNSSRDTKTQLNESMSQAASKIRRETKVSVSTESETSREFKSTSEITNENDEIAVTYVYSKMQRQYEVSTFLADLNMVIYVAEHVPGPREMTQDWFERHASTIGNALLDARYEDDLNAVLAGVPASRDLDSNISSSFIKLRDNSPDYSATSGTPPDPLANMTQAYSEEVQRERELEAARDRYEKAISRIRSHISDNILHYCRAIWSGEDPHRRILRYRDIMVPSEWDEEHLSPGYVPPRRLHPNYRNPVRLSDMIDPTGPVGFYGNYAVYRLRQQAEWSSVIDFINAMRLPYLKVSTTVKSKTERLGTAYSVNITPAPEVNMSLDYEILYNGTEVEIIELGETGRTTRGEITLENKGGEVVLDNRFRLTLSTLNDDVLQEGDRFSIHFRLLPELEDPEVKYRRWNEPLPDITAENSYYSIERLKKMIKFLPDLGPLPEGVDNWEQLDESQKSAFRDSYHEYTMHEEHTRHILVDTNNVMLSRVVDPATSLEPFKAAHRYIDVLSAVEEFEANRLENLRLSKRIDQDQLEDPDIEKTIVINSDSTDTNVDPT